jgi:putative ABC transport system permease protein
MLSIIIGLWAGLFTMAFVKGLFKQQLSDTILNYISNIQLHHPEFSEEQDPKKFIDVNPQVLNELSSNKKILAICPRIVTQVMMASPVNAIGVNALGIKPVMEDSVTGLFKKIIIGTILDSNNKNGILIGEKVLSKLKVKLKSKVVLSFQDVNGDITSAAYRVAGVFKSSNSSFDESNVYVLSDHLQSLIGLPKNAYHEVAVLLKNASEQAQVKTELKSKYPHILVQDWMDISPELNLMINSFDLYMYIFIGIILLALSFGIINTMLMSVLERVREFGMLMAIGMSKPRLFFMIILETLFLTLAGSPLGFAISYFTIYYFNIKGINLSMFAEGLAGYGYATIVYPTLAFSFYPGIYLMTFFAALLASLYPAAKALKLKPVEAIRKI